MPFVGMFQMRLSGFREIPVDHYMRHFWMAAENSTINRGFCFGPRPKYKYIVEYVKDFFKKYSVAPKFTVATIAELSHANNDPVASIGKLFNGTP